MLTQHPALSDSALTMPLTPIAPIQPDLTFSDDQYESVTYHKWFERHTGLSLDEAITLGLATRDHSTEWKTTRSSDGSWHLRHRSAS
jgi:hypothetical protein